MIRYFEKQHSVILEKIEDRNMHLVTREFKRFKTNIKNIIWSLCEDVINKLKAGLTKKNEEEI